MQHECDHLDGILYPQRMRDLSQLVFAEEMRHWTAKPQAPAEAPDAEPAEEIAS
jgi:peptide deformylase